jgi:hypothetical protein
VVLGLQRDGWGVVNDRIYGNMGSMGNMVASIAFRYQKR